MPRDLFAAPPSAAPPSRQPRNLFAGSATVAPSRMPLDVDGQPINLPMPGTKAPAAPVSPQSDFNETAFAQGTSGVNEGIATALGAPVDLANLALRAGAAGVNAATGSDIQLPVDAVGGRKTFTDIMAPAIRPESDNPGNQAIRRIGEEVGASLVPAGGVVARSARPLEAAATQAAVTLGSGAAAAGAQQVMPDNPYVEMAAQILGGGGVAAGMRGVQRAVTPFAIPAERAAMNATMAREGVDLSAGQQTGNKGLQYAESELGGRGADDLTERQAGQFTQAALSRAGISAARATPEVMDNAFTTIGRQFDELAARNTLIPDQQMGQDLGAVVREYNSLVPENARAPVINATLTDLVNGIRANGAVTGDAYQALSSRLARLARGARNDPQLSDALMGIRSALDDTMERAIQANNPADLGAWQQARTDYRNLLVLENAASKAGENTAMGLISPANLRMAAAQQGKRAYVRGQGDFSDLARSGVATMTPLPQSGTAPRQFVRNAGMSLPALLGAAAGGQTGNLVGAAVGAGAGAMVPGALGKLIMSGPGRAYLTNQAWTAPVNLGEAVAGPTLGALATRAREEEQRPSPLRMLAGN